MRGIRKVIIHAISMVAIIVVPLVFHEVLAQQSALSALAAVSLAALGMNGAEHWAGRAAVTTSPASHPAPAAQG